MTQLYWIDASAIFAIIVGTAIWIRYVLSPTIIAKNKAYNTHLNKLRENIFYECEKNFFL